MLSKATESNNSATMPWHAPSVCLW